MNLHLAVDITTEWRLDAPGVEQEIDANLDGIAWRRTHVPEALSWLRSRSVSVTGELIVSCVLTMMGVNAQDVLAHICNTLFNDMQHKPKIRECNDPPIHGALPGDEPPPPPTIMFGYYFQLSSKYGISFYRDTHLFNDLPGSKPWQKIDKYQLCICGLR